MLEVLIADDHPLFREALVNVVAQVGADHRCLEACSLDETVALARARPTLDVILLDLMMPGMDGLAGLTVLRREAPGIPVVVVSASSNRTTVLEALEHGAVGFITKTTPRKLMVEALRQILQGAVYLPPDVMRDIGSESSGRQDVTTAVSAEAMAMLTRKQLQVLERLAQGESNKEIARALSLAEPTVKAHVSAILRKFNVRSRAQAMIAAANFNRTTEPKPERTPPTKEDR